VPEWVSSYLGRVARNLCDVSDAELDGDKLLVAVAKALEIRGRRGGGAALFERRRYIRRQQQLACDVASIVRRGIQQEPAVRRVAEFHKVSTRTVERACRDVRRRGLLVAELGDNAPRPTPELATF
jgi:hypothetical protein